MKKNARDEKFTHYFTNKPLKGGIDEESFSYQFQGENFIFYTASGVFSRHKIDTGSEVLITTILNQENALKGGTILDLGCGYGPVGIVIGRFLSVERIIFADVNERATHLAAKNIKRNGLPSTITLRVDFSNQEAIAAAMGGIKFDFIAFNPPIKVGKDLIRVMVENVFGLLKSNGRLYLVIKTSLGARSWQKEFQKDETIDLKIYRKSGYRVFMLRPQGR